MLLKTSSLFEPFPTEMGTDTAFLDRMHCYLPGWEIPKFRPEHFTDDYGFITDYLSEFIRELRKEQYGNAWIITSVWVRTLTREIRLLYEEWWMGT